MWDAENGLALMVLSEDKRSATLYVTGSDPSALELDETNIVFEADKKGNKMLAEMLETSIITGSDVKSYTISASKLDTLIMGGDIKQMIGVSATKLEIPASSRSYIRVTSGSVIRGHLATQYRTD